jgi:bacteriocin-like protein
MKTEMPAKEPLILELHDEHMLAVKELQENELDLVSGGQEKGTVIRLPDVTVTSRETKNDQSV